MHPLYIWTDTDQSRVTEVLAPVVKASGVVVHVVKSLKGLPEDKIVLVLGDDPRKLLAANGLIPKNRTITSMRHKLTDLHELGKFLFSYSVGIKAVDNGKYTDLLCDTRIALRMAKTGSYEPTLGEYRWVLDFKEAIAGIKAQFESNPKIIDAAFDTETVGSDPYAVAGRFVVLQFTWQPGKTDMVYFASRKEWDTWLYLHGDELEWLLNTKLLGITMANGKFDCTWVKVHTGITCTNFKFDTLLVGSLLDENRSNSLNVHAKIYTSMGGYDDCVTPDTLVMTSDLRWVEAGTVKVGDELVGFDEFCEPGKRSKLRTAVAESTKLLMKPGVRVTMSDGRQVTCSYDHGFLAHKYKGNGPFCWVHAQHLRVGCRIQVGAPVESMIDSYEAGYLSGLYDGEGYVSFIGPGILSGLTQKPGTVWDTYTEGMKSIGLSGFYAHARNVDGVMTSKHTGWPTLRMLQLLRPNRLLEKRPYEGKCIPSGAPKITVMSVEHIGAIKVVSLQTSTHTFLANGLCSHNSFNSKIDKSRMDLVPKDDMLSYAGGDTHACYDTRVVMRQELLKDTRLASFYVNILHPAGRAFEEVEQCGVSVDHTAIAALKENVETDLMQLIAEARKMVPGRIFIKHEDETKFGGINLQKASFLKDLLFSPQGMGLKPKMYTAKPDKDGNKVPSTAMEHIAMFEGTEAEPFIRVMKEYGSAKKILDTYITGFLKHLRSDGKFHPQNFLFNGDKDEEDTGGTNCLPAGELVLTSKGYLPVEKVEEGMSVLSHTGVPRKVTGVLHNGVKAIIEVTLANGLKLRTTDNHRYLVKGNWVRADTLTVGLPATVHSSIERWASISGWGNFAVSTWGRVYNSKTHRMMTLYPKGKWGHLKVALCRNGSQKRGEDRKDFAVHRLVCDAFHGMNVELEVRHKNGIAWDNTEDNLAWGTALQNRQDAVGHGTMNRRHGTQAKLTDEAVAFIRAQPTAGRGGDWTNKNLAKEFGVCPRLIRSVRSVARWEALPERGKKTEFSTSLITSIVQLPALTTYGLTVAVDESHVTAGVVTHNTGRISVKAPAFQCLKGTTLVLTAGGWLSIETIVKGVERGVPYKVLTHTGKWQDVIGAYRNGVQPVFDVRSETGKLVASTGNHPYLTQRGWVRTDELRLGDHLYELRSQDTGLHQPDLPFMDSHEESLSQPNEQGLGQVRGSWDNGKPSLERLRQFPDGHGREASGGLEYREERCERPLLQGELCLGNSQTAGEQSHKHEVDYLERGNEDGSSVGGRLRDKSWSPTLPLVGGPSYGGSLGEGTPPDWSTFQEAALTSVTPAGECETFDLTIENSHSFVANGIVVHNTIPKHGKWGKLIRKCYPAPPGYAVLEADYSQGELRVVACVANESHMIQAYRDGQDLHTLTAGRANNLSYAQMLVMKEENPTLYDMFRQRAKAGNFGLLYGMGAAGFQIYARRTYGVVMTLQEAEEFRDAFFASYPGLISYHAEYKQFAKMHGYVRSPLGRIRHLPLIHSFNREVASQAERQSINSPIQGALSDMMLWAIAEWNRHGHQKIAPVFGAIHDASYTYAPEDKAEYYAKTMREIMENLPFEKVGWNPQLKFVADVKIGPSMGDLHAMKWTA